MSNILIINGHQFYPYSQGRLNKTLVDETVSILSEQHNVKTTTVQEGYDIKEEQEKIKWADTIIFQTPIYWFSLPTLFKQYFDEVYEYGVIFAGAERYGQGGLLTGKTYMLSTTWNAPESEYGTPDGFFKGLDLEGTLEHIHATQRFVGMEALESFSIHDVIANPQVETYLVKLREHLNKVFELKLAV
ncbi:NAD(P)H-dependent oxidoreductase [Saccharibacillus alkalitolerans]|uniref:NAD(P)H-dependent oxidoreductase n=1 Tax=Saccharibacillus alkalitolerans TaxID=2705290 RepID=A0ABX0F6X3_9BACL|nr:NAD(P)H-dependent oxidoreductase [Saccharibacillus alkalitolerans]NGZ76532.1 NAD(P)H-dependent oxidoreductase [Saccharibacillus alkalitolerans]